MLIAFVDVEQRPSRSVLKELAASERSSLAESVEVIPIHVGQATPEKLNEWRKTLSLPWRIGIVTGDWDAIRWTWGAKSLPWLILTDKAHWCRPRDSGSTNSDNLLERSHGNAEIGKAS